MFKIVRKNNNNGFYQSLCACTTKKYNRNYDTDSIVSAPKGTLGLMLFVTLKHAIKFLEDTYDYYDNGDFAIFNVEGIGDGTIPEKVLTTEKFNILKFKDVSKILDTFYNGSEDYSRYEDLKPRVGHPPEGTICYQSVKVLELVWDAGLTTSLGKRLRDQICYDEPPMDDDEI